MQAISPDLIRLSPHTKENSFIHPILFFLGWLGVTLNGDYVHSKANVKYPEKNKQCAEHYSQRQEN